MGEGGAVVDLSAINDILSIRNGVWSLVALFVVGLWRGWAGLPAVMQQWIARRQAIAAEKDAEWRRLSDEVTRLAARHDECEDKLAAEREERHQQVSELRDELAAERAERTKQQAINDGRGEVRQAAASAAAEVRLDELSKRQESSK